MSTDRMEQMRKAARELSMAIAAMQPHMAALGGAAASDWGSIYLPIIDLAAIPVFQGKAPRCELNKTLDIAAAEAGIDPAALMAYVEFLFAMTRYREATNSLPTAVLGGTDK